MSLNVLKSKITTYQSTQKVTKAMRNISAAKMQKIKHNILLVKANIVRIKTIFPEFFSQTLPTDLQKITIVFGPKKGLCGGLSRRVMYDFMTSEISKQKSTLIIAELPVAKLLTEAGFSISACFNELTDTAFPTLPLYNSLLEFNEPILVNLFFPSMNHHKLECKTQTFLFNNKLAMFAALEYAYYETRLAEEEKRVEAMTTASDNCEKIKDATKLKYFKLRQQKITQEILEVSN
jgi:F0F1-type ATP synthase gamma subunit